MSAGHQHGKGSLSDRRLLIAVLVNLTLTFAQVIGGQAAGSLSLIADALHNLSDAGALALALAARRIAGRRADASRTFGYGRAEIIGALVNLTTLGLIGLYLVYEAVMRLLEPQVVAGWIVVFVAGIALIINVATAALTYRLSKHSLNVRAAFVHNVSDALGSLGVVVAGVLILVYGLYVADAIVTILIAAYVLYQVFSSAPRVIAILMQSTPPHLDLHDIVGSLEAVPGVQGVHHVHLWELDEHTPSLEAHVVMEAADLGRMESVKAALKQCLLDRFGIDHSTLEFEFSGGPSAVECAPHETLGPH